MKAILTAAVLLSLLPASFAAQTDRPNVLFIAVDDLRPELGCYGNPRAKTPHIDRLAKRGVVFRRAYCQEAICSPSRASLMTGMRPDSLGVTDNVTYFRDTRPDVVTLPQHFREHGYETVFIGKVFHGRMVDKDKSWSRNPRFAEAYGPRALRGYQLPASREIIERNTKELTAKYGAAIAGAGLIEGPVTECADVPDRAYQDGFIADTAVLTLRELKGKPFFFGVGFHKPHLPFVAPKKYWDLYDADELDLASNSVKPRGAPSIGLHSSFELRTRDGVPKYGPIDDRLARHLLHGYLACASYVDAQIGKVVDELDRLGLSDSTVIMLWGDHGWHLGEYGIWGKATNYEIATRVPLVVCLPGGRAEPAVSDALVELVDMYPTLCDMAGLPLPAHLEGRSFAPLVADPALEGKPAAFSQFPCPALREWAAMPLSQGMRETWFGPLVRDVEAKLAEESPRFSRERYENHVMGYTMRTDRWRLVLWVDRRTPREEPIAVELYDQRNDPRETVNLARDPQHAEVVRKLSEQLRAGWPDAEQSRSSGATPAVSQGSRDTLSLDGTWQIVFDPENVGREAGWHRDETFSSIAGRRTIEVPSCWELTEKDYEGVAFYRRTFKVPASWEGKVIRLHFDAVNFRSEVWLNGRAAGSHEGGFTPFELRVDKLIRPGEENTLTLRVVGPILLEDKRVDGMGPMETPQWRGAIAGGIWQPVRLIATGDIYVSDVFVEPRISDNTATFHLELVHAGETTVPAEVEIAVRSIGPPDRVAATARKKLDLKPGSNRPSWTLSIPDAAYWSPDHPHLYRAEVSVACGGSASDRWNAQFGMREFTIRDEKFHLNGEPLYLKATFFEGLYPVKLAYPDSRGMVVREIQLAKDAGFNMIRPWRKPPPPTWLDVADELGVMTVGSMAIECMDLPIESERLPGWVENEVRQSILRDRNRACVVQWELFNELKRPVLKQMLHPMSVLARRLDPTRLILDESGGWAQGANMYLPYRSEPTKFNDVHDYPGPQINEEVYEKLRLTGSKTHEELRQMGLRGRLPGRNVVPGRMTFFSELGYGSLPDLVENNKRFAETGNPIAPPTVYHRRLADQHRQALKESGFDRVYPDLEKFCLDQQQIHGTANRRMIEAVRCNPRVQGYCIHALTAGDWITGAGLLDLFRNPKTCAYEGTKAASRPRVLSIRVRPRNVYAERGTKIEITGVNETGAVQGNLKVDVVAADGRVVFAKTAEVNMGSGITQLFGERLDTKALRGTYAVKAEITADNGSPVAGNAYSFDVFTAEQLAVPKTRIAVLDPANSLKPLLRRVGIEFVEFDAATDRALPVLVSRTQANTPAQRKLFGQLAAFIKAGGTVVYLQGGGPNAPWGKAGKASPLLPMDARLKRAIGNWTCIPHIVKDHPVFDGLPAGCMMGPIYENVWAQSTLLDVGGETIAGAIGYDSHPDYDLSRRHYYGPGDVWWGADVAIVPLARGRSIVSQLRLVENLGSDPVADRILLNLVRFAADAK